MLRSQRVFQLGFCGDWVEIYRLTPRPKDQGEFFVVFREKRKRKALPLMFGVTPGGVKLLIQSWTQHPGFALSEALTRLCLVIGDKMRGSCAPIVLP